MSTRAAAEYTGAALEVIANAAATQMMTVTITIHFRRRKTRR